jgi:hypothetical protein
MVNNGDDRRARDTDTEELTHGSQLLTLGDAFLEESFLLLGSLRCRFILNLGESYTQVLTVSSSSHIGSSLD